MNIVHVIRYAYKDADFNPETGNVEVRDDGDGQYISKWELSDPEPTISELEDISQTQGFKDWNKARKAKLIDRETNQNINEKMHPQTPQGEQIAAIRDAIAYLYNELGITPPQRFQDFNKIAVDEVTKGQDKKSNL